MITFLFHFNFIKHALPITKRHFLKMIADGEDFARTIRGKLEQEIARARLTTIID